jgi:hypothetical protein
MFVQCKHQFLTRTLSAHISSLRVSSACFEGTFPNLKVLLLCREYVYGQGMHQFLMCILSAHISLWRVCSACFEGTALSASTSFGLLHSMHSLVPYVHAEDIHNELEIWKTDVHAEHACMEMFSMIRVHISSWRAHSVHASVFGPYAHHGHVEDTHFSRALFLITLLKHLNRKLFADATWLLVLFYQMS